MAELEKSHSLHVARSHNDRAESLSGRLEVASTADEIVRATLAALMEETTLDQFLGRVLQAIVTHLSALGAELWIYDEPNQQIHFHLGLVNGKVTADPASVGGHRFRKAYDFTAVNTDQILGGGWRFEADFVDIVGSMDVDALEWYRGMGVRSVLRVPVTMGSTVIGNIAIWKEDNLPYLQEQVEVAVSLAHQAALSIHVSRLAGEAKRTAIAQEREKVAEVRAADLAVANRSLKRSITRLVHSANVDDALIEAVRTAVEVVNARSGVLGLFVPEEQGFRNLFMVIEGQVIQLDTLAFESRLYSLEEEPLRLAWNEFQNGNDVLWCDLESQFLASDSKQFLREYGLRSSVLVALKRGTDCIGYLGLSSAAETGLAAGQREMLRAIADQMSLMLELSRLARASEEAAIAREREKSAQERAEELGKANEVMRTGVNRLVRLQDLDLFLGQMLRSAAEAAGAHTGAVVLLEPDRRHYRFAAVLERTGAFSLPDSELLAPIPVTAKLERWISGMMQSPEGWPLSPDDPMHAPETLVFHKAQGNRALRHIPMMAGDRLLGWLGLGFADVEPPLAYKYALLRVLADQMTMAVEMLRLAESARMAALSIERERSAQERELSLRKTNESLTLSNRLLGVVSEISSRFAQRRDFEASLTSALQQIGEVAGLGRVLLLEERPRDDGTLETDHHVVAEWCAEGIASHRDVGLEVMATSAAELFMESLRSGKSLWYRFPDLSDDFQKIARTLDIMATGCAPVFINNSYWGTITFDNCKDDHPWDEAVVHALTAAANAIAGALQTEKDDESLELSNRLLGVVAEVSTRLARIVNVDASMLEALGLIGKAGRFSRVLIFQERRRPAACEGSDHHVTTEWCAPGVESYEQFGTNFVSPEDDGPCLQRLHSGQAFWCRTEELSESLRGTFQRMGTKATGCAPVMLDGAYWGNVSFDDCVHSEPWGTAHLDAFRTIAQAISNALQTRRDAERLATERERSAKERASALIRANETLRSGASVFSQATSPEQLFSIALRQTLQVTGAETACLVERLGEEAEFALRTYLVRDGGTFIDASHESPLPQFHVAYRNDTYFSNLMRGKPAYITAETEVAERCPASDHVFRHSRTGVVWAFPFTTQGITRGYMALGFGTTQNPDSLGLETAEALACQVSLVLETLRSVEKTKTLEAIQQRESAVQQERTRLSEEMHDGLQQTMAAISLQVGSALVRIEQEQQVETIRKPLKRAAQLAEQGLKEIRDSVRDLNAGIISDPDAFMNAVFNLCTSIDTDTLKCVATVECDLLRVPQSSLQNIYRILQEAAQNVVKHAAARKMEIRVQTTPASYVFTISDDGCGIASVPPPLGGMGFKLMEERARRVGGRLNVVKLEQGGTQVSLVVSRPQSKAQ